MATSNGKSSSSSDANDDNNVTKEQQQLQANQIGGLRFCNRVLKMDKMPTNNSSESLSSDTNNDNNVPMLGLLAEQQNQQTNLVVSGGPRPRFCDDVLLDALHFLRRKEHAQVRLTSRRLQWLSDTACARYPPRVVPRLEVRGVYASPTTNGVPREIAAFTQMITNLMRLARGIVFMAAIGVPRADAAGPRFNANSMRIHPASGNSYLAHFPTVEPPENITHLLELAIYDFISPELLQFLRVSARLMNSGCRIVFTDFDNFIRHHSTDFAFRFFALFPSKRAVHLRRLSSLAAPLFIDHPTIFDCTVLVVHCSDTFPLDALQHWLHLDDQQQQRNKERYLSILVGDEAPQPLHHSLDAAIASAMQKFTRIHAVDLFVQHLRQRFLNAISCCPFTVEIKLVGKQPHRPMLLEPFVEDNQWTGEQLVFSREGHRSYTMDRRRRRESTASAGRGEVAEARTKTTMHVDATRVHIYEVVQGDKQQMLDSEDLEEK